ncbi:MAG: UDP-N-acetylmuramate--L-alanine ligase [Proteobacteria bacterium]|nr:UDP-N-acetylmuramate--L-alanine ligase [Pseudomonadota bacterium]
MHDPHGTLMHRVERIHFIGVGGSGMSGIAEVLSNLGYKVSGSDQSSSRVTERLRGAGVTVLGSHVASNVDGADVVVYSSAIADDNVELMAARAQRIPVVPRAEMLAELMRFRRGICIAGTHGKTTTTSLVATVLAEAGLDPTFVVGGLVKSINANARLGAGRYLVAEADESDASFLLLHPLVAVLTNVDADHMATYHGDFAVLKATFVEFFRRLPFYGVACVCLDDAQAASLIPEIRARVITYGVHEDADVRGYDLRHVDGREHFRVALKGEATQPREEFVLNLPGEHNVQNALASIAVARELGVDLDAARRALSGFQGIARRCQIHRDIDIGARRVTVIDDYGHHPKELEAVLKTIRRTFPDKRLVVVFQPHRYTRTRDLFEDFAAVLSRADVLVLLEVYAAGEAPIAGADGRALARAIRTRGHIDPVFVAELGAVQDVLADIVHDDDVVALLGAGNIGAIAEALVS